MSKHAGIPKEIYSKHIDQSTKVVLKVASSLLQIGMNYNANDNDEDFLTLNEIIYHKYIMMQWDEMIYHKFSIHDKCELYPKPNPYMYTNNL